MNHGRCDTCGYCRVEHETHGERGSLAEVFTTCALIDEGRVSNDLTHIQEQALEDGELGLSITCPMWIDREFR